MLPEPLCLDTRNGGQFLRFQSVSILSDLGGLRGAFAGLSKLDDVGGLTYYHLLITKISIETLKCLEK